jgi:hypothetical protein
VSVSGESRPWGCRKNCTNIRLVKQQLFFLGCYGRISSQDYGRTEKDAVGAKVAGHAHIPENAGKERTSAVACKNNQFKLT